MSDPFERAGKWVRVLAGVAMAASALVFAAVALLVLIPGVVRSRPGEQAGVTGLVIATLVCALLAAASLWMARRLLRRAPAPTGATREGAGRREPKRVPPSVAIISSSMACTFFGVWIASAGSSLSFEAHPGAAVVGGSIGLLLGLAVYVDDRSLQRRLQGRARAAVEQPDAHARPPEGASPQSEAVALVMLAIPIVAGVLLWQQGSFHLTARAAAWLGSAAVVSTAVLGYVDARRLLLRPPVSPASSGGPLGQPPITFANILCLWVIGYPAHFVARRLSGARNLVAPALVATAMFCVPTLAAFFSKAALPSVDSPDVVSLVEKAIMSGPVYQARKADFGQLSIRNPVEVSFDREKQRRVARATLVWKRGEQSVFYTVDWQDRDKGMLAVRVYDKQP